MTALSMLIALAIDAALGWPDPLYRRIGHPVTWIGALIARLDKALNRPGWRKTTRCLTGLLCAAFVVTLVSGIAFAILSLIPEGAPRAVVAGILAWPLVATRSMHDHVAAVVRPLASGDIEAARHAVAMIVGRDPSQLDEAGIARAAVESLAENTSDGITAPIFWGLLLGLPGIAAYKAANTLDSMIGYRTEKHEAFGWAAARFDDLVNLVPARLTGLLFALTSARPITAIRVMVKDARHHRSPNAGWPEAAMAGALDVRLSGPRVYDGKPTEDPYVNPTCPDPKAADLWRGLALYRRAMLAMSAMIGLMALV
ncbi:adenosylcobinamide-phosphate synthase CbiB [Actibacterium pelagium]|uniref:Cobalamin biosynthesis protein CobD n=1 Tax=Actibacterium pelagium TaxID=2029103 RepID=A0A917AMX5_9RHOB|nr:adenosylcobinamide-phosphate synthase CbiB [Actibacterium pelagium]GGE60634.1 cobalamin biosynthesis protein CobD [Actibacterium pelagium]